MKRLLTCFFILNSFGFALSNVQATQTCHVVEKNGDAPGSLPWQAERIVQEKCDQVLFTTMEAPLHINLEEALIFPAEHPAMISGANYGAEGPLVALGVVIDARELEDCAVYIEDPEQFSIRYLTFWVNHWDKAICDFEGRSILRRGAKAYPGDTVIRTYYPFIKICAGYDNDQHCAQTALPPLPPPPSAAAEDFTTLPHFPPPPPHPNPEDMPPQGFDDFVDCTDSDQDQLCNEIDLCDLSVQNPEAPILAATMAEQCPHLLLGQEDFSPLCSQKEDLDEDRIGNACDPDADGDGFPNRLEKLWGNNPLDFADFPKSKKEDPQESQDIIDLSRPASCELHLQTFNASHSFFLAILLSLSWVYLSLRKEKGEK